jgi:hypothetical protein
MSIHGDCRRKGPVCKGVSPSAARANWVCSKIVDEAPLIRIYLQYFVESTLKLLYEHCVGQCALSDVCCLIYGTYWEFALLLFSGYWLSMY